MIHYHVKLSDQAENDLRTIFEYIAFELLSPDHAKEQLERLEEQIDRLDQMPDRCASYKEEPWHSRGLRFVPVDHYVVFYLPNKESRTVTILRVLYGGSDMEDQLRSTTL